MSKPTALDYVTTPYGKPGSWAAGYHTGIDYRAPVGTYIFATKRGRVVHAGWGGTYGAAYGSHVVIRSWHRGRRVQHLYAHLSETRMHKGQRVKTGWIVGLAGETGNAFGAHLHYEERTSPFGYWQHYRPVLPNWYPRSRRARKKILARIAR